MDYSCREIDTQMAVWLINSGNAGFYAYRAQAPIPNPHWMCVYAQKRWWLIERGEFVVEDHGIQIMADGGWTWVHRVRVNDNHPIARKLAQDAEMDAGPDLPLPVSVLLPQYRGR